MNTVALLLLAVLLPTACEVSAQEGNPASSTAPASSASAPPAAPKNLFEALPNLRWDPATQGPLLMVAPQLMSPPKPDKPVTDAEFSETTLPLPVLPPPALVSGVYRTRELLDYFGSRQVRLRGMTVFAPATMVVLNTKPGKPDLYAKMAMQDRFQMLQATLTPEQWKQIGSPQGLGRENLEGEQRDLFEAVLPNPFVYQIGTVGTVLEESGEAERKRETPVRRNLTPQQRSGIRLRMTRDTQLLLTSADPSAPYNIGVMPREPTGTQRLTVYENIPRNPRSSFGAVLSETVPSRLKQGQIDFDAPALGIPVTLDGALTVGDLIDRIRAATRVEISADRRLARLPVVLRAVPGTALRAGEVLKAVCWGTTGAIRHVRGSDKPGDSVFILTDDIEGLGNRFSTITEWSQGASSAQYQIKYRLDQMIRRKKAIDAIGFAPEDNFAPNAEQNARIEKAWANARTRFLGVTVPMTVLPPNLRERARQSALELNTARAKQEDEREVRKVSEESVNLSVQLSLRLEVPELGVIPVEMWGRGGLDSFLPKADYTDPALIPAKTITLPPSLRVGGVLSVAPAEEEEARAAVRTARLYGLRQVWIAASPGREDASSEENAPEFLRVLRAAIEEAGAGGGKPVAVLAAARVLTVPRHRETEKKQHLPLDINIDGLPETVAVRNRLEQARLNGEDTRFYEKAADQSRDWLLPDAPGIISRVTKRLSALAAMPGLSGIILTDLLPPGYRTPNDTGLSYDANYISLGYTPRRRVSAIRSLGYDPIDIVLDRGYVSYDAPGPTFFEDAMQQLAAKTVPRTPNQQKALSEAARKGDLDALAENSPAAAWNALRFRAANELITQVYQTLSAETRQKAAPFGVYIQSIGSGQWFGTWDQRDKLPLELGFSDKDRNGAVRLERSAHAASKTVLYRQRFVPSDDPNDPRSNTDDAPLPPAEKFARDFNRQYDRGNKSWDGCVFDLQDIPWSKAQEVLKAIVPPAAKFRQ